MRKKIRKKGNSVSMLRQSIELRKQELFNIALHYADLLGARKAAEGFIDQVYDSDDRVFWSWGPDWCESLQEYKMNRPIHRAVVLLAFFAHGTTHLIGRIVNHWNGIDPFADELKNGHEAQEGDQNNG